MHKLTITDQYNQYPYYEERKKIYSELIASKKPCVICNSSFASYDSMQSIQNGGLSVIDFVNQLQNCFTMYQNPFYC